MAKRYFLTNEEFRQIVASSDWRYCELSIDKWPHIKNLPRRDDVFGVFAGGSTNCPKMFDGRVTIAGMDVLVREPHPMAAEPEGNAYHFAFQKIRHADYPFIMYGPYTTGTVVPHWFSSSDLDPYWNS